MAVYSVEKQTGSQVELAVASAQKLQLVHVGEKSFLSDTEKLVKYPLLRQEMGISALHAFLLRTWS